MKIMRRVYVFVIVFISVLSYSLVGYCLECKDEIKKIIAFYDLKPLNFEGGYFRRTYTLRGKVNEKPQATAIIYLLTNNDRSLMHKLDSDEIYHFYAGDPITMVLLNTNRTSQTITLGKDFLNGQMTQVIVQKNTWHGSYLAHNSCYSLLGTTMTPGFDFKKFQLGIREKLIREYPKEIKKIMYLTN